MSLVEEQRRRESSKEADRDHVTQYTVPTKPCASCLLLSSPRCRLSESLLSLSLAISATEARQEASVMSSAAPLQPSTYLLREKCLTCGITDLLQERSVSRVAPSILSLPHTLLFPFSPSNPFESTT